MTKKMQIYNPTYKDIPNFFDGSGKDKNPLIKAGESIEFEELTGKKIIEQFGFLVDWTELPKCPTFRSNNVSEIKEIVKELFDEQKRLKINKQKEEVFSTNKTKNNIFISFRDKGKDKKIASQLFDSLKYDYSVFHFEHSKMPSEELKTIIESLRMSDLVVFIKSNETCLSSYVIQEIGIATEKGIPIFPIIVEQMKDFSLGFHAGTIIADRFFEHNDLNKTIFKIRKVMGTSERNQTLNLETIAESLNDIDLALMNKYGKRPVGCDHFCMEDIKVWDKHPISQVRASIASMQDKKLLKMGTGKDRGRPQDYAFHWTSLGNELRNFLLIEKYPSIEVFKKESPEDYTDWELGEKRYKELVESTKG